MRLFSILAVVGAVVAACAAPGAGSDGYSGHGPLGGQINSSPAGAQVGYTLWPTQDPVYDGHITATVRDVAADGKCAWGRISLDISFWPDPGTETTVCGNGNTKDLTLDAGGPGGEFVLSGQRIETCLSVNGELSGCTNRRVTVTLYL